MSMSSKKCCVPGCTGSGGTHLPLHLFPNPNKDRERFNSWVLHIGGDIIGLQADDIYKHRRVCHRHFEEKYLCRNNRISNIAAPSLHLPGPLTIPKFNLLERRPMREMQNTSLPIMEHVEHFLFYDPGPSTSKGISVPRVTKHEETMTKENIADPVINPLPKDPQIPQDAQLSKKIPSRTVKHTIMSPNEKMLHKKLIEAKIKLSKCRSMVKKQALSLKAAKTLTSRPNFIKTLENLPSNAKIFTLMQLRENRKKNKGRRFTLEEKLLALAIFKRSPKSYRFLRNLFILPAPQTLIKLLSYAKINPGINRNIFQKLQEISTKMKFEERLCILMFDEIALKPNVAYNVRNDKVIGFVTDGEITKPEFADHAQVFMIRGLIKNYKQPIAYTFSAGATKGPELAKQIKKVISAVQNCGLNIIATVCDQGANNRSAINILCNETRGAYLRAGSVMRNQIFKVNDCEIIPLYDPPHLMKCIRNNLLTKNLLYKSNDEVKIAKWDHIMLLHKENPGYKGLRLIPKLTDSHILQEKIPKMKVKYATQVFSRTVASNMGYLADKGIIPAECKNTADILLFFDDLFDSVNGSFKKRMHGKPLLGPLKPNSVHHKIWNEGKKILNEMRFIKTNGNTENVPVLKNWVWTLEGIKYLFKKLIKEYEISSVWLRHLNQDPIENFFGAIRSHGCRNVNPTPEKFQSAFTSLLISNISSVHASGANCENDFCSALYTLVITDNECKAQSSFEMYNISNICLKRLEEKMHPCVIGALIYVSGYFLKKAKSDVFKNCIKCSSNLMTQNEHEYLKYREYSGKRWLCNCSESLLHCISNLQDVIYTLLKKN